MKYLLDTNIISEPIKLKPSNKVIEKIQFHEKNCVLSSITWHELNYGLNRLSDSKKKQMIKTYLTKVLALAFPILPYDVKAAEIHAEWRARSEHDGRVLPFSDSQIASIALANQLTLVTRNIKDFTVYEGLNVENWFE